MAHLWSKSEGGWNLRDLGRAVLGSSSIRFGEALDANPSSSGRGIARLVRVDASGASVWALVASGRSGIRVNGRALPAGLCVLTDRDEIRDGDGIQYFFTAESLAAVQGFPCSDRPVFCGRCRQQIAVGAKAVRCPGCGIWYDESAYLPCWTYSDKCTFCGHPTVLDSGFSWTPEEG